jgi:hypothetical protein
MQRETAGEIALGLPPVVSSTSNSVSIGRLSQIWFNNSSAVLYSAWRERWHAISSVT